MRFTLTRRKFHSPGQSHVPRRVTAPRRMTAFGLRSVGATAVLILVTGCGSMTMEDAAMEGMDHDSSEMAGDGHDHSHMHESEGDGTVASLNGYTLDALETTATSEYGGKLSFRIMQENGVPVTNFEPVQTKPLHLYVVSEDLSTYHHLHPTKDMGGTWRIEVPALPPGRLHVVTDFVAIDESNQMHPLVLGSDLTIDGAPEVEALPEPAPTVKVDGYTASLGDGLVAGQESKLSFKVTKKGEPALLEPYLNAWAHTSVFAADTLAFSHVHPAQEWKVDATSPDELTFVWTPEAPGNYRFFIQFQTASGVHLAEFTRTVTG